MFRRIGGVNLGGAHVDTIYFTHSHHSRFLQIADVIVFMANRCHDLPVEPEKYPDAKLNELWQRITLEGDLVWQTWPEKKGTTGLRRGGSP